MAFVLSNKPTFHFRVEVKRPGAAGTWETLAFLAEFKRRSPAWVKEMTAKALPDDDVLLATELVGWKDVKSAEGGELKASEETRAWMLDHPDEPLKENDLARTALLAENYVAPALVRAWIEATLTGPRKN